MRLLTLAALGFGSQKPLRLQSMMNAKLSQQKFWALCHKNWVIKTISVTPHDPDLGQNVRNFLYPLV